MSGYKKISIYALSVLAIVLWGMSYIWSDKLLRLGIIVEFFVFVRILIAGILLLLFNLLTRADMRIRKKDLPIFLLLSFCEPLIYFVCETYGIRLTESPTYSALVIASTPIFSVIAGFALFREKISLLNIIGVLVCLGGLVMVTLCASSVGEYFVFGVILLLTAVLAEVGHASCTKALSGDYKPQVIVMYQFLFGSLFLLPLFLTRGLSGFDSAIYFSAEVVKPILYLAVLCSSIAFSLWVFTIKHLGVAKSSIFLAMIPVVTALSGAILGHEVLSRLQWVGIAIACCGVIMTQYACRKNKCDSDVKAGIQASVQEACE